MNVSVERLPDCKALVSAEIPADEVSKTRKTVVGLFANQANVPGFRPGKTPTSVIEKRYAGPILDETKDRLARSVYAEAQEKHDLALLGISSVEREDITPEGAYLMAVEVVVEPDVEVKAEDYQGIPVEVPRFETSDEMIDGHLTNLRERAAEFEPTERASEPTDVVIISYQGTFEGKPATEAFGEQFKILESHEDHWVNLPGEGQEAQAFIPGFAEALVGKSAGDEVSIESTFPDDFGAEEIAGKTLYYDVTVTEVRERKLPELDEEFAKSQGVETLEELREQVVEMFKQQYGRYRDQMIDNQILGKLNEEMSFDLPEHIVFGETQRQVNQMAARGYEQGMSEEQLEESQEDLVKSAENQAKNNVKTLFILNQIAAAEGLKASDDELSRRVSMMAMQQGRPVKKLARELRENNGFDDIRQDIVVSKTIEFLRESAVVTETDPPEPEKDSEA
ncbi:MAG: trigger factor [Verrucomicrobiota bacterium]